jgi:hypothetical protein
MRSASYETDPLLESGSLLQGQRVRLGNDRDDVDHLGELFEYGDVDLCVRSGAQGGNLMIAYGLESVSGGVDEEDAAVDPCVRDETITHGRQLFSQVRRVLVLDLSR